MNENDNVLWIGMNQAAYTDASKKKYLIGTSALATCTGIAAYNPMRKIGSVAQVWYQSKTNMPIYDLKTGKVLEYKTIDNPNMFEQFSLLFNESVSLVNRDEEHASLEVSIVNMLSDKKLEKIVDRNISYLESKNMLKSVRYSRAVGFVLDTRNGEIELI